MGENPYADVGSIVQGDRFLGRVKEIRAIRNRLLGESGYGGLSILGMPRVGKSSLVNKALCEDHEALWGRGVVPTRIEVGSYRSSYELFQDVVRQSALGLQSAGLSSDRLESAARRAIEASEQTQWTEVRGFFRLVVRAKIRMICILDEFDAGRYLFAGTPRCFHWLRELASNAEFKVGLVLVTKRSLADLSKQAGHESSYWANVMEHFSLTVFDNATVEEFFRRLDPSAQMCPPEIREELLGLCGAHPYLLDTFAYHAYIAYENGISLDVTFCRKILAPKLYNLFKQITDVFQDGARVSTLVQILLGPQYNVTKQDVDDFVEYGIVKQNADGMIQPFSLSFRDYLSLIERSVDIWPLWRDTEESLRDALNILLVAEYGQTWVDALRKAYPKLQKALDDCKRNMEKERTKFDMQASENLLAYTYPLEIFQILASNWPKLGKPLLGKQSSDWAPKFQVLASVRTPLAHNRVSSIKPYLIQQAEGYCREILDCIRLWRPNAES